MTMVKNLPAPGDLLFGQYVFASRRSDCDWNDPWAIGFVSELGKNFVSVANEHGEWIEGVGPRMWPYAIPIPRAIGPSIIEYYIKAEGTRFDPAVRDSLFSGRLIAR